jgi:hypothetical protein
MGNDDAKSKPALGFLTVVDHPQYGLFGGYLVLTTAGRPLEFHCTAPIKPNRAQEILYGPTLNAFLYGEQIGQTLLSQASAQPLVVCTDCEPALAAREFVQTPLVLVLPTGGEIGQTAEPRAAGPEGMAEESGRVFRLDAAHQGGPRLVAFQLGRNRLALPQRAEEDRRLIHQRLAELAESFDLTEPFQRIREAIEEAQQAVR